MDRFTKLFGPLLVFVYHCFDRIVIHGYLSGLSRRPVGGHIGSSLGIRKVQEQEVYEVNRRRQRNPKRFHIGTWGSRVRLRYQAMIAPPQRGDIPPTRLSGQRALRSKNSWSASAWS
jgi:hypothetical protein